MQIHLSYRFSINLNHFSINLNYFIFKLLCCLCNNSIEAVVKNKTDASGYYELLDFTSLKEFVGTNSNLGYAGYQISQAKIINILLVGRGQSGKSTLLETFMKPQQAVRGRGFSVTRKPTLHTFVLTSQDTNVSYTMNVIDTPGLREKRIDDMQSRSDEEIINLACQFLSNELTYLNIVIYVAIIGKTHERDIVVFDQVKQFLGAEFGENSMLVLSHCENYPKDRIDQCIEDMKKYPETNEIIKYCKLGVFPYGTLSGDELASIDDEEDFTVEEKLDSKIKIVTRTLTKIEKMRKSILDVIFNMADQPRQVTLLKGVIDHIEEQKQQAINEAFEKEKENLNQELDKQLQQYNESLKEMQKKEFDKFQREIEKQIEQQQSQYEQRIKEQAEQDRKIYEERLNHKLEKNKFEFEQKICTLNEAERGEEARRFALEQERQRKEQKRIYEQQLEPKRREQERLYKEQEREKKEIHNRLQAELKEINKRCLADMERQLREIMGSATGKS